jgi:hypothetical protein
MWLPFTGVFIGLIGFPSGTYSWNELPLLTRYSLVATGILFALSMIGLMGSLIGGWAVNRRVLRDGERAEALVMEIWDTGSTINEHPVVGFRLQVEPLSGAPFEAKTERVIPRLMVPNIQAGTRVPVRYDPRTKAVALDI